MEAGRRYARKGNKENAQPTYGSKTPTVARKDERNATETIKRQTLSQVFLTKQATNHKKLAQAANPPVPLPPAKTAMGLYKGKVVQSKIGSIWKTGAAVKDANQTAKPLATKAGFDNSTKIRPQSVLDLPGRRAPRPKPAGSQPASDRYPPVSKYAAPHSARPAAAPHYVRPAAAPHSARPPTRTAPAALPVPGSSRTTAVPKGKTTTQSQNPKVAAVATKKVSKPPVAGAVSQYRVAVESAEERRAKLAEWLAAKGKTLRRPAMAAAPPPRSRAAAKSKGEIEPRVEAGCPTVQVDPESEPRPGGTHAAAAPRVVNTTLDNSDVGLPVEPESSVDVIVGNLCDTLAAEEDEPEGKEVCVARGVEAKEEGDESDECEVDSIEASPETGGASVVMYSVKTTPFLQSVRKTLDSEATVSGSGRKSGINDLKFLTPVRRSNRIQGKSSRLPAMVMDHDLCVSSLAELVRLDDDANAYIYRRNPALTQDLPDHRGGL